MMSSTPRFLISLRTPSQYFALSIILYSSDFIHFLLRIILSLYFLELAILATFIGNQHFVRTMLDDGTLKDNGHIVVHDRIHICTISDSNCIQHFLEQRLVASLIP